MIVMIILVLIFLGLHLLTAFAVSPWLWGFDAWHYLPEWAAVSLFLLGVISLVPKVQKSLTHTIDNAGKLFGRIPIYVWIVIFALLFYIFSQAIPLLGDGRLRVKNVEMGVMFIAAEPLDTFLHSWLYKLLNPEPGVSAQQVFKFVSILSGLIAFYGAWFYLGRIFAENKYRWLSGLLLLTSGAIVLFFGYTESYTVMACFSLLFLLSAMGMLREGKFSAFPAIFICLGAIFHPLAVIFAPAAVYAYVAELKEYQTGKQLLRWLFIILIILAAMGLLLIIAAISGFSPERLYTDMTAHSHILPLFSKGDLYGILSIGHINDVLNQLALTSPALIALPFILFNIKNIKIDNTLIFLLIASAGALFLLIVFKPDLGYARDWDLFAVSGFPLTLLIAYLITSIKPENFNKIAYPLVFVCFLGTSVWIGINANTEATIDRALRISQTPYWVDHANAEMLSVIASCHKQEEKYDKAAEIIKKSLEYKEYNRYYYALAEIYMRQGNIERAVELYEYLIDRGFKKKTITTYLISYFTQQKNYSRAKKYLKIQINDDPQNRDALYNLGLSYYHLNKPDSALFWLDSLVDFNPKDINALELIGQIQLKRENYKKASETYGRLVELLPKYQYYYYNLAFCYLNTDKLNEADSVIKLAKSRGLSFQGFDAIEDAIRRRKRY